MSNIINIILESIFSELVVTIFGVLIAQNMIDWWRRRRFGGWNIVIRRGTEVLGERPLTADKARMVLDDDHDLSVFIKGVVSSYEWLNTDILGTNKEGGIFRQDDDAREFIVDLEHNPPRKDKNASQPAN